MPWLVRATNLLLLFTLAILALFWFQYGRLTKQLGEQRAQIAARDRTIATKSEQLAALASDDLYLLDALLPTSDFLGDFNDDYQRVCGATAKTAATLNFCYSIGSAAPLFAKFNDAAFRRKRARTRADYEALVRQYQAVDTYLRGLPGGTENDGWVARAREGVAYALLQTDRLDEAAATIAEARRLDPLSAVVGTTSLKIACKRGQPAAAIRAELDSLRERLAGEVTRARGVRDPKGTLLRNKQLEREYVEKDELLYLICRDAGIAPRLPA